MQLPTTFSSTLPVFAILMGTVAAAFVTAIILRTWNPTLRIHGRAAVIYLVVLSVLTFWSIYLCTLITRSVAVLYVLPVLFVFGVIPSLVIGVLILFLSSDTELSEA